MSEHVVPGRRLGKRKTDKTRPVLNLRDYLGVTNVPPHPAQADHFAQVPAWNGDTNFNFGTCGPCDVANSAIDTWKYLLNEDISVSDEQIFDLYRRSGNPSFDPNAQPDANGNVPGDGGVDMTVMLSEVVKNGLDITHSDGTTERIKAVCFAAVQGFQSDIDVTRAAIDILGGVSFGLDLETAQQAQTDASPAVWDYSPSPDWGGHATYAGLYTSAGGLHISDISLITWTQPVGTTDAFLARQDTECYVIVWPPHLSTVQFQQGIDEAALAADYTALTGRAWPVPTPGPSPTPVPPSPVPPAPTGDQALDAWAKVAVPWAAHRHVGANAGMQHASIALLKAKGYLHGNSNPGERTVSILSHIHDVLEPILARLDAEARADLKRAVADAEAEEAKLKQGLASEVAAVKSGVMAEVKNYAPEVKAEVQKALDAVEAAVLARLG